MPGGLYAASAWSRIRPPAIVSCGITYIRFSINRQWRHGMFWDYVALQRETRAANTED